ncbi:MAG: nucleotidyltransferase family protein [Nanoarchaeota archaeon]|nr:nucleotidyltransferase family protein [Nanoarchaeota archaeon]
MKAIILSAGLGTRIRPLTDNIPKVMLPINEKPLLEHHINLLRKHGITDIAINLHYMPNKIIEYFQNGSRLGVKINYSHEKELLGTSGAVKKLKPFFKETFIVVYGDVAVDVDFAKLIEFHKKNKAEATLVVHESDHPEDSDVIEINEKNEIVKLWNKPHKTMPKSNLTNAALYILEPEIINYIPEGKSDFIKDVFPSLLKNNLKVMGYNTEEFIKDMGTLERYEIVKKYFKDK